MLQVRRKKDPIGERTRVSVLIGTST